MKVKRKGKFVQILNIINTQRHIKKRKHHIRMNKLQPNSKLTYKQVCDTMVKDGKRLDPFLGTDFLTKRTYLHKAT